METWVIAVFPLVGVVLGAVMQFILSRAAAREQRAENLRSKAYADYLRAVAAAAHPGSEEDKRKARRDFADAKARIAVYGSVQVITAMARFEEAGANISNGPGAQAIIAIVSNMRQGGGALSNHQLRLLLLGPTE